MCTEYIVKCRYCGHWRHYSWDRCGENRQLLKKGCALGLPSQHPSECDMFPEDKRQRIKRQMTPYECPVKECKSTEIAGKLFEERAKIEAARAAAYAKARAEWEAKDKARKAEFAAKYFKKLPVVRFSERRQSFLDASADSAALSSSQAIQSPVGFAWLSKRGFCTVESNAEPQNRLLDNQAASPINGKTSKRRRLPTQWAKARRLQHPCTAKYSKTATTTSSRLHQRRLIWKTN
ncbi:hypothetical protein V8C35DRAFT_10605 [Trichoderma chlorosporum]